MKYLISLMVALVMTGCSTVENLGAGPLVDVANSALNEPTIKSGMTSRDAAYMTTYKKYADTVAKDRPIVKIEGTGAPITISGIKSIEVYAPGSNAALAAPEKDKPAITQILDSAGRLLERVFLPWTLITENAQTAREQNASNERIRTQELGIVDTAVRKEPVQIPAPEVITIPAAQ